MILPSTLLSIDHSSAVMHTDNSLHFNNHTDCMLDELHRDDVITAKVHARVTKLPIKKRTMWNVLGQRPPGPPNWRIRARLICVDV